MRLAKLELAGFKSFADYTEFVFDHGVTGIVGPNGCGKSNVVDAVKWVLGEMSAKSLRGDAMLDVIFNGSGGRKPMGMSEVSLTFTNEDRRLPIEAAEVKITRRLYRDSTSEYLINNQMSRLKDIRELFMDTGVGVDAYSLIEQGRVSALLEASSEDRREIFEEAAGISKFKQRKKEALRKLEKTQLNLEQSQLVLGEVEKQLRSVKVQAGRARNYQEYQIRLKDLRSAYVMQEYDGLHRKDLELRETRDAMVDQLAASRRDFQLRQDRYAEVQLELESAQDTARRLEREVLSTRSEQQAAGQRRTFALQQVQQLTEQHEAQGRRQAELEQRFEARQLEARQHEESLARIDEQLKTHIAEVAETTARQEQAAKSIAALNRSLDEQKSRAIELMRQTSRFNNDIHGLKINQENLQSQKARTEQRRQQIESQIASLEARSGELEETKTQLIAQIAGLQQQAQDIRNQLQSNNQKQAQLSEQLARQREGRSALKSRQNVLQDLQARREGVNQIVRDLLKLRDTGKGFGAIQGIVADYFNADIENALAVEAALGEMVNSLVIGDSKALVADAATWQKVQGRVHLLALDQLPAYPEALDGYDWSVHKKSFQRAISLVQYDPALTQIAHHLLGRTLIVESLSDALELSAQGPRGYRFVTRQGEVFDPAQGVWQVGDMTKRGGVISRRSELAKLETDLVGIEKQITALAEQISQCDQDARGLDGRQQEIRQQIFQTDSQRAEVNAQLQQTLNQLQRTRSEAPLIQGELDSFSKQLALAAARQAECEARVVQLEEASQEVEGAIVALNAQFGERQREISELNEAATRARVAMGQVQEQRTGLSRALAMARQNLSQTQLELQRLATEIDSVEARMVSAQEVITQAQRQIEELGGRGAELEKTALAHAEALTVLRAELSQVHLLITQLQAQVKAFEAQDHQYSLGLNELRVRMETLIAHTQEELQIALPEIYSSYQPQEMDWPAVAVEINELKNKIARLGNVNLDAILEQEQLEDRQKTLSTGLADILQAKAQLEELIGQINEDSRARFAETFEKVRLEFQEMFRKLFGGGKADVVLENPDDILESGIEIMARPPGKELQSISLLSGGEKTMTAVALVLSIFKSKPSPFCILDEVDAALDEANTGRFASIVQEFLVHSQFILITHNKRSMSIANVLYGVTMQEQGVSKRVAVKFDGRQAASVPTGVGA